ncbi:MAG: hypothetical protein V1866_03055 [archaeon]
MTKLREFLRPKSLAYILDDRLAATLNSDIERMRAQGKDRMMEWDELDEEDKAYMHALKDMVFYNELMHALKRKAPARYEALKDEIRTKGADAEIDIKYLERKFPMMRQLNSMFKVYGAEMRSGSGGFF